MSGGGSADVPGGRSRRRLLRDGVVGAAAVGGILGARAVASAGAAGGGPLPRQDARILNFLLELERLQATFFERAAQDSRFRAELRQFARVAAAQDKAHADALRSLLGSAARTGTSRLKADPKSDAEFIRDALDLKEAAVAAYIGEGPNLQSKRVTDVAGIVSVEARHAAWIRSIKSIIPAPRAADRSQTPAAVVEALEGGGIATIH